MKYAVEQRLRFIDFILDSFGYINRHHLMDYYGVSLPQATMDFKMYFEIAPDNGAYDGSQKRYCKTEVFKRIWE